MKTRNVSLTLEKAKEFYNSGNDALREVALQVFTEDELQEEYFKKFTSWEDIEDDLIDKGINFSTFTKSMTRGQIALLKLSYIRLALNKGKNMKLTESNIYYPYTPFIAKNSTYYNYELKKGIMNKVERFKVDGEEYVLLGGAANYGGDAGLGSFYSDIGVGTSHTAVGFLGCASKEIAKHMSRYFAKEIFEAKYGDFVNYEWI